MEVTLMQVLLNPLEIIEGEDDFLDGDYNDEYEDEDYDEFAEPADE